MSEIQPLSSTPNVERPLGAPIGQKYFTTCFVDGLIVGGATLG
jgi:hypothetical protein